MTLRDAAYMAASGLKGNLVRTLLTILGLAVGVAAVLTVLTLGNSGEKRVEEEIVKLGVNKIWIRVIDRKSKLDRTDAKLLSQETGVPACAGIYSARSLQYKSEPVLVQVAGVDENFEKVYRPKVTKGRTFMEREHILGDKVCLIDEILFDRFGDDVIGDYVALGYRQIKVIGVIKSLTSQSMSNGCGSVILPINTYMDTFSGNISEITLSIPPQAETKDIISQSLSLLGDASSFRADSLEQEINAAREVVRIFVMVLLCVSFVCMLTGGIGVMNVLLLAVRERKQEIGLIKAVGGTEIQVCILFLLEAISYAVFGGGIGIAMGIMMSGIFGVWIGLSAAIEVKTAVMVLLFSVLIGIIFGVGPALKAAGMNPVDALQCE